MFAATVCDPKMAFNTETDVLTIIIVVLLVQGSIRNRYRKIHHLTGIRCRATICQTILKIFSHGLFYYYYYKANGAHVLCIIEIRRCAAIESINNEGGKIIFQLKIYRRAQNINHVRKLLKDMEFAGLISAQTGTLLQV